MPILNRFKPSENTNVPDRLFVVFCRIDGLDELKAEQIARCHRVLLDLADDLSRDPVFKAFAHQSSVYGRIYFVQTPTGATQAAELLLQKSRAQGIRLAIGISVGRVDACKDLGFPSLKGPCISMAARLTGLEKAVGRVFVTEGVCRLHHESSNPKGYIFDGPTPGKVKRTDLSYHALIISPGPGPDVPESLQCEPFRIGHAVVYDIARFSELSADSQLDVVDQLSRCIGRVSEQLNLSGRVEAGLVWYSPAGDGGAWVFKGENGGALAAVAAAQSLAERCLGKVDLRVSVAMGMYTVLDGELPVGPAILRADDFCSEPPTGGICLEDSVYRETLSSKVPHGWELETGAEVEEAVVLRSSSYKATTSREDGNQQKEIRQIGGQILMACREQVRALFAQHPWLGGVWRDTLNAKDLRATAAGAEIVEWLVVAETTKVLQELLSWTRTNATKADVEVIEELLNVLPQFGVRAEWIQDVRNALPRSKKGKLLGGKATVPVGTSPASAQIISAAIYDTFCKWVDRSEVYQNGFDASGSVKTRDPRPATKLVELRTEILSKIGYPDDELAEQDRIAGFLKHRWEDGNPVHVLVDKEGKLAREMEANPSLWQYTLILQPGPVPTPVLPDAHNLGFKLTAIREQLALLARKRSARS